MQSVETSGRFWAAGNGEWGRVAVLGTGAVLVAGIAFADWKIQPNVSLGFFYIFPILIAAGQLERWETVLLAAICAGLREAFAPFSWDADTVPRMAMVLTAFVGTGLFASELKRNRQLVLRRLEAEESLRALVDTSPAAILTVDAEARVSLANDAAHRLLGFEDVPLRGQEITPYLPALASAVRPGRGPSPMRTMIEERGQRRNGEAILTHIWFSTYDTSGGRGLAAIVLDVSEDFRDREHGSLQSVMWTSRVVLGALNHEVRNVCEALAAVHANLSKRAVTDGNADFQALGALVDNLRQISSAGLGGLAGGSEYAEVDPGAVLEDLRMVMEAAFREQGAVLEWDIEAPLPKVRGDHHTLLRVFMNLAQNSLRAMECAERKQLTISASPARAGRIAVRFRDTGPGVAHPERLFRPFHSEAQGTGLGLYVSRALVRSSGGDLNFEPQPDGAVFAVELMSSE